MSRWLFTFLLATFLIIPYFSVSAFNLETEGGLSTTGKTANIQDTRVSIGDSVAVILKQVLSLVGVLFFCLMLYAGFLWMTAAGNDKQIEKARDVLTAALIGLIIVIAAYSITQFVGKTIMTTN